MTQKSEAKDEEKLSKVVLRLMRTFDKEVSRVGTIEEASSRALLSCVARHALDDFDHETRRLLPRDTVTAERARLKNYVQGTVERETKAVKDRIDSERRTREADAGRRKMIAAEFVPRLVKDHKKDKGLFSDKDEDTFIRMEKHSLMQKAATDRSRPRLAPGRVGPGRMGTNARPGMVRQAAGQRPRNAFGFSEFDDALDGLISQRRPDEFFNGEVLHVNPIRRHLYPNQAHQTSDKKCVRIETTTANVQEAIARGDRNRDKMRREAIRASTSGKQTPTAIRQLTAAKSKAAPMKAIGLKK